MRTSDSKAKQLDAECGMYGARLLRSLQHGTSCAPGRGQACWLGDALRHGAHHHNEDTHSIAHQQGGTRLRICRTTISSQRF